jgi:hypothetical protein
MTTRQPPITPDDPPQNLGSSRSHRDRGRLALALWAPYDLRGRRPASRPRRKQYAGGPGALCAKQTQFGRFLGQKRGCVKKQTQSRRPGAAIGDCRLLIGDSRTGEPGPSCRQNAKQTQSPYMLLLAPWPPYILKSREWLAGDSGNEKTNPRGRGPRLRIGGCQLGIRGGRTRATPRDGAPNKANHAICWGSNLAEVLHTGIAK